MEKINFKIPFRIRRQIVEMKIIYRLARKNKMREIARAAIRQIKNLLQAEYKKLKGGL